MTVQQILNQQTTKTKKIEQLLRLGKTRSEVAELIGSGYGFVQNVYAKIYPDRIRSRRRPSLLQYVSSNFDRKFGVEIECFGTSRNNALRAIRNKGVNIQYEGYNHDTRAHWKIVTDGSVSASRGESMEIVSPILRGESGLQELEKVCQALEDIGVLINKSCGLHIHFDASELRLPDWKSFTKNYISLEPLIDSMMPRSRRGNSNTYCKSLIPEGISKQAALQRVQRARNLQDLANSLTSRNRYRKVNFESYWRQGSVEFRQHSGTREFPKMKNWILFLHHLLDFSQQGFTTDKQSIFELEFLPSQVKDFYNNRIEELA